MKKSFRKAGLPAIAMLIVALMSLTTVTYAWFTASTQATIDKINVNVQSAMGLQITNAASDEGLVFEDELLNITNPFSSNPKLHPASTNGVVTNGELTFFTAEVDRSTTSGTKYVTNMAASGTENGFVGYAEFVIGLRNTGNEDIMVNFTGTTITGDSATAVRVALIPTNTVAYNSGSRAALAYQDSAARIYSVANETYLGVASADDSGALYDQATNDKYELLASREGKTLTDYYVWSGNVNGFVAYTTAADYVAIDSDAATSYLDKGTETVYDASFQVFTGVPTTGATYYLKREADLYELTEATDLVLAGSPLVKVTSTNDTTDLVKIEAMSICKLKVVIWLEGQDSECTNTIAGIPFAINFIFNAGEVAE